MLGNAVGNVQLIQYHYYHTNIEDSPYHKRYGTQVT